MGRVVLTAVCLGGLGCGMARGNDPAKEKEPAWAYFCMQDRGSPRGAMTLQKTDSEGRGMVALTQFGQMNVEQFNVTPDGKRIICFRTNNRGPVPSNTVKMDLVVLDSEGKLLKTIDVPAAKIAMPFGPPSLLPDGVRAGFVSAVPEPRLGQTFVQGATVTSILTVDLESTKMDAIATLALNQQDYGAGFGRNLNAKEVLAMNCGHAAWSPGGKTILCTFEKYNEEGGRARLGRRLWVMDSDGGDPRAVGPEESCYGMYSPNGQSMAYVQLSGNTSEIFMADANGGNPKQVTHLNSILASPRWLSDGKSIEFFKADPGRGFRGSIWAMNVDGTGLHQISPMTGWSCIDSTSEARLTQSLRDAAPAGAATKAAGGG